MQPDIKLKNILAEAASMHRFMDMFCTTASADYRAENGEIFCAKGCSSCCTLAVNCTAGEALLIAAALTAEQRAALADYVKKLKDKIGGISDMKSYLRLHRRELGGCPFREEGICGIYEVRPISCRALLATKESRWCGVDFSELSSPDKLAFMESLDRKAVAFPMHYLAATQDTGQQLEAQTSLQMMKEFGFSLYGNMPVLAYLFTESDLQSCLAKGADSALAVAASAGLDSPFLLQVEKL
jgi:Fe-S-cluster containining protein